MSDRPPVGNSLQDFGAQQRYIDNLQYQLDLARARFDIGEYAKGNHSYTYYVSRAPPIQTGILLYPCIYRGWLLVNDNPKFPNSFKEVSFMKLPDIYIASKIYYARVHDPAYPKMFFPTFHPILGALLCVEVVYDHLDINRPPISTATSSFPVYGNPSEWQAGLIRRLVNLFLSMTLAGVSCSFWNLNGCYLVCEEGVKVVCDIFEEDDPENWNASLGVNLGRLADGIRQLILIRPNYWPLRGSFLGFFFVLNAIEPHLITRVRRILRHPFLMMVSWQILMMALAAFQYLRNTIPAPGEPYFNLYRALNDNAFVYSLNQGVYCHRVPGSVKNVRWRFKKELVPAFKAVLTFGPRYSSYNGTGLSNYVRNAISHFQGTSKTEEDVNPTNEEDVNPNNPFSHYQETSEEEENVNPNNLSTWEAHMELEQMLPCLFHRVHEFLHLDP